MYVWMQQRNISTTKQVAPPLCLCPCQSVGFVFVLKMTNFNRTTGRFLRRDGADGGRPAQRICSRKDIAEDVRVRCCLLCMALDRPLTLDRSRSDCRYVLEKDGLDEVFRVFPAMEDAIKVQTLRQFLTFLA